MMEFQVFQEFQVKEGPYGHQYFFFSFSHFFFVLERTKRKLQSLSGFTPKIFFFFFLSNLDILVVDVC